MGEDFICGARTTLLMDGDATGKWEQGAENGSNRETLA